MWVVDVKFVFYKNFCVTFEKSQAMKNSGGIAKDAEMRVDNGKPYHVWLGGGRKARGNT